ncbi:MAG TPA: tetratricopeptide repeat protein [bacterium]|nr:tetratricopeptide repeat protein [bacterium]
MGPSGTRASVAAGIAICLLVVWAVTPAASLTLRDKLHSSIAKGNKYYDKGQPDKALEEYRKATGEDSSNAVARFNAGDALYKMGKFKDGASEFTRTASSSGDSVAAMSYYNLGNTAFKSGDYRAAAEAYKRSLLVNPDDKDAKFNLEYALRMIQQQQQQQQNQDKNQQPKPDEQQQKQQQQQQQQQQAQQQQQQAGQNQQPSQGEMTPDELKRILAAIDASDRQTQQELLKQAARTKHLTEKDW